MILPDFVPTNLQYHPKPGLNLAAEVEAAGLALIMERIKRNTYPHFCIHVRLGSVCTVIWFGLN